MEGLPRKGEKTSRGWEGPGASFRVEERVSETTEAEKSKWQQKTDKRSVAGSLVIASLSERRKNLSSFSTYLWRISHAVSTVPGAGVA